MHINSYEIIYFYFGPDDLKILFIIIFCGVGDINNGTLEDSFTNLNQNAVISGISFSVTTFVFLTFFPLSFQGDLAKKKIYPTLWYVHVFSLLNTNINLLLIFLDSSNSHQFCIFFFFFFKLQAFIIPFFGLLNSFCIIFVFIHNISAKSFNSLLR